MTRPTSRPRGAHGPRLRRRGRHLEEAFSLIEVVIALFLLAVTVVPVTLLVVEGQTATTHLTAREEATDLATRAMQQQAYTAAHGEPPSTGTFGPTPETAGQQQFEVTTTDQILSQGGASTVCEQPNGQSYSQLFVVSVLVSWGSGTAGGDFVKESTIISPNTTDFAAPDTMEIVVPVLSYADAPDAPSEPSGTYEDSQNLNVELACTGAACGDAPAGLLTSGTAQTVDGCAVFTDVYVASGLSYSVTVHGNPGWVSDEELSDATTASGDPTQSGITPQANTVYLAFQTPDELTMDQGAEVGVQFAKQSYPGSTTTAAVTTSDVSITAEPDSGDQFALGDVPPAQSGFVSSGTPTQALLFPYRVSGSGNDNYSAWAGTWQDANPGDYSDPSCNALPCPPVQAVTFLAGVNQSPQVHLPVYPLVLSLDDTSGSALSSITATPLGNTPSTAPLQLNYDQSSPSSDTSLPLGAYELRGYDGSSAVSLGTPYVWITPSGVCAYSSAIDPQAYTSFPSGAVGCDGTAGAQPGPSTTAITESY